MDDIFDTLRPTRVVATESEVRLIKETRMVQIIAVIRNGKLKVTAQKKRVIE